MTQISSLKDLRPKAKSFQLHHPLDKEDLLFDKNNEPLMVEVVGIDSNAFRDATIDFGRQELDDPTLPFNGKYKLEKNLRLAAACVSGWSVNLDLGDFSKEKALEVCLDPGFNWFAEQVAVQVFNKQNFFVS